VEGESSVRYRVYEQRRELTRSSFQEAAYARALPAGAVALVRKRPGFVC
jgi:hypothetical protein